MLAVLPSVGFGAIFLVPNRHLHDSVGHDIVLGVFFFGLAGLGFVLASRIARAGLLMASGGIVVRNPLRTVTLVPTEVEGFVPGITPGFANGTPCPRLTLRSGRAIGVWALGREGVVWRFGRYQHELQPLCDELNATLLGLQASSR